MLPHRASRRAYPEGQFAPMKWVNIKDLWYYLARAAEQPVLPHCLAARRG